MIVAIKNAVLHILDPSHRLPVLSEHEMDVSDGMINTYLTTHIEKVYDDPAYRKAEFKSNSSLKFHIDRYREGEEDIVKLSKNIAERIFEGLLSTQDSSPCDIAVCELIINERRVIGILKLNNKTGFTHQVIKDGGGITNTVINHYSILPAQTQKITEYAFVDIEELSIRYKSAKYVIDGEKADLFADIVLECDYEISSREAVNTVTRTAKKITAENGGDTMETAAKIKECVIENIEQRIPFKTGTIADRVFDSHPVMKDEFKAKMEQAAVPDEIDINKYVTKKMTSNIRLVTDTGVELSFPAEYYSNSRYVDIVNNEDGTISISINNIGELTNK